MNAIVIEHVPIAELPEAWRQKLGQVVDATVTVRIEPESPAQPEDHGSQFADDPLFGMWRERKDMADVETYIRRIRAPRFSDEGNTSES